MAPPLPPVVSENSVDKRHVGASESFSVKLADPAIIVLYALHILGKVNADQFIDQRIGSVIKEFHQVRRLASWRRPVGLYEHVGAGQRAQEAETLHILRQIGVKSVHAHEFNVVSGLNADHKNDILAKYHSFRKAIENAARFSLPADKVRKGHMAAADEVFGGSNVANSCGLTRHLLAEHKGNVYRLLDSYCMNPSCKCGETYLSVVRADKDAAASDKPWITLRLHFEGKTGLSDVTGPLTSRQAAMLIAEWIQKDPALLVDIEARYKRIKEIGRRILKSKAK